MPVTKTTTVISNNITLTAGSGTTTSTVYSATVGWHKMVHIKLTNGGTPPATPASAIIEASADNSNWYNFNNTTYTGPSGASGVMSWTVLVWSAVQYLRVTWTAGDTQNVTARAEVCDATEIAESATGDSNSSNATADSSNTALRTNLYNEVTSTFVAQNQVTVGTSAAQLASNACVKGVTIKALNGNTGIIYVGNSSGLTTSNGFELGAGESISLPLNNSNLVWVRASVASQKICYAAI